MAKQANKALIGGFVVGAIALAITGVVIFGSGRFLSERITAVMFFEGSVKGLNVGASVVFRGVRVGSVSDIVLQLNVADRTVAIPVYVQLEPEKWIRIGGTMKLSRGERVKNLPLLIERGLRAQLQMQSLVTGQLMIALDLYPDKPARLTGGEPRYPEIPTIPTDIQELQKTLDKVIDKIRGLPLEELFPRLLHAVEGIDRIVNSPDMIGSVQELHQALEEIRTLARNIDAKIAPLAGNAEETMDEVRKLVRHVDGKVAPAVSSITEAAKAARLTLEQANTTLARVDQLTSENSSLHYLLTDTLEEVSAAARSVRVMADYLEQHPEALLRGKAKAGGK